MPQKRKLKQAVKGAKKVQSSSAKKVILAIAIAIVLAFFVNIGINVFYPSPEWEDFCDSERFMVRMTDHTQQSCEDINGRWHADNRVELRQPDTFSCRKVQEYDNGTVVMNCDSVTREASTGYCDETYYCAQEYQENNEKYSRNVFVVLLLIGLFIIAGSIALQIASVSSGLMAGGVIVIITGIIRYWQYSTDVLRFLILGAALVILIWLGYKRLNR